MVPDQQCLFRIASTQHGLFTASQANACGISNSLLRYHAGTGTYIRKQRGVYRFRDYPSYYREHVMEAVLAAGKDRAVVSHESALELYELSDVLPRATDLTLLRKSNRVPRIPGVKIHLTTRPWKPGEIRTREGIPLTSPERSIIDAADWGTGPEQIEMAIIDALDRGMTTPARLRATAEDRNSRVQNLVNQSISLAEARRSQ